MRKNELSNKDREYLKENLAKALKEYNKFPSNMPLSVEDDITGKSESEDIINNKKIIRELVFNKLDNECPIDKKSIVYKTTLLSGKGMAANYYSFYWTARGSYYYRIYLFKSDIVIYSLDDYYRVIASRKITLSNVDFAGISEKDTDGLKLSEENLIVKTKGDKNTESLLYYFAPEKDGKEEMKKLYDLLIENGVRSFAPNKLSKIVIIKNINNFEEIDKEIFISRFS